MTRATLTILSSTAALALVVAACSDDSSSTTPTTGPTTTGSGGTGGVTSASGGNAGTSTGGSNTSAGGKGGAAGSGGASGGTAGSGGSATGGAGAGGVGTGGAQDGGNTEGGTGGGGIDGATDASAGDAKTDAPASDAATGDGAAAAKATVNFMPLTPGTITGTATFTASGANVTVVVNLENCPMGPHPIHIHAGTGCADMTAQGAHWDPPRGENIGPNGGEITCGADMKGTLTYTRLGSDAKPWTIGGAAATDVVGHPMIVHGVSPADATARQTCGVITRQ